MRKLILAVIVLVAGYFIYHHFFSGAGAPGGPGMMGGPVPVGVSNVIEKEVVQWDEFSGRLTAVERVEIRPRVGGSIDAIHFQDGQMVAAGDKLISIDPKPYEAALQAAKARAVFAEGEFTRAKTLLPEKAVSQREYDDKRAAAEAARADLVKAQLDLGYAQIKAPVNGRVSRAEITVGNLVSAGGEAPILTTIVSLDPIYVDFDVDEQTYVKYLAANKNDPQNLAMVPVQLALSGEQDFTYEGTIKSFDNELNTRAGTVRVRAIFDNKMGTLIPGLFAHVRVGGAGMQKTLLINERAINTDQNKKFVYVVGEDKKAQYRQVVLGPVAEGMRVVREGLAGGETIVVNGLQRVQPGAEITPQPVDMQTLEAPKAPEAAAPAEAAPAPDEAHKE